MPSGPSKSAEAIVALLIPPSCREEVLGDLYERYTSPRQYAFDALSTVPLVIVSRIRRAADPQVLLMQAFVLYLSFLGSAWLMGRPFLEEPWAFPRLAIPACMALLGLMVADAYAKPGQPSIVGPVVGIGLALVSQGMLWAGNTGLDLPSWILLSGCAMSLLLTSAVRGLFPPVADQLQGVNAPASWLKRTGEPIENSQGPARVVKYVVLLVVAGLLVTILLAVLVAVVRKKDGSS